MKTWVLMLVLGLVVVLPAACGGDGGEQAPGDALEGDVAEVGMVWESIDAPVLGGFMKLESYGCREDAIFVAVSGGQQNNIYKLDLGNLDAGWKDLNDSPPSSSPLRIT